MAQRRVPDGEAQIRRRVAAHVRRLRKAKTLTALAASERVSMHLRLWQKLEAADLNFTLQTLVRVASALEVDVRELLR